MPRILLITTGDARSIRTWSGTSYHVYEELTRRYGEVATLKENAFDKCLLFLRKVFNKVGFDLGREDIFSRLYDLVLRNKVRDINPDIVVSVAASQKIARLRISKPIVHVSDATFAAMRNYYPRNFRSLSQRSLSSGEAMEQRVLTNCSSAMLSSQWAADSAIEDYAIDPAKLSIAQFGANVSLDSEFLLDDLDRLSNIDLLFVGVEWERKGGPVAFDLAQKLLAADVPCKLHIVGCSPPLNVSAHRAVVVHGFLNKHESADLQKLQALFKSASFLVVPSRQEAFGLVFAEAAAYGLPVLATRTGGIPSVVDHGSTGLLIGVDEGADIYLDWILYLRTHPSAYEKVRADARVRYTNHLTWKAWGDKFDEVLKRLT